MDKLVQKRKIVESCIQSLENSAQDVRNTIDEIIQIAADYEGDHDMFDPFKDDMMKKKDLHVEKLQKYLDDIKLMHKLDPKRLCEQVEFGAVVITDKQKMFIAAALGKITIDNETYYAISTQVPVFKAMQGLKKGEMFTINNNQFKIIDLF